MTSLNPESNRRRGWVAALATGVVLGTGALTVTEASANGMPHVFTYENNNVGTPAISGTSAVIESIFAAFDENDNSFTWNATYSADTVAELPTGFTLVVNNGPMPKTHLGELAVLYYEDEVALESLPMISSTEATLTAYAYNGGSSASAHRTSDFRDVQSATPAAPDRIGSSRNGDFESEFFGFNFEEDGKQKRFVGINIDASIIRNHSPLQPSIDVMADEPLTWTGIGFAEEIGIWFHPFNNINPEYGEDGFLINGIGGTDTVNDGWQVLRDNYGFFDVDNLQATTKDGLPIPEPASALLLLAGVSMLGRRGR